MNQTEADKVEQNVWLDRIGEVRETLFSQGPPWTRDRADDFETISVSQPDCDVIRDLLIAENAETVVEIGLAYASSALAIGEALVTINAPKSSHLIIDPFQATEWSNVGWQLLQSAGLDAIAQLILQPSSIALPQLIAEGFTADAAFVDGSHKFHEVFVDLYFLRKIVRPGGLIILDDFWWPSVNTAQRYFITNLGWQPIEKGLNNVSIYPATGLPRLQALRLPDPPIEPAFNEFQPF